jgi:phosphoglycerol transferase
MVSSPLLGRRFRAPRIAALYAGAALLSYVLITLHLGLSFLHPRLAEPFDDLLGGDGVFFHATLFKGVLENGWNLFDPAIGLPGPGALYQFPVGDLTIVGFVALLRPFHPDAMAVSNALVLASYPLTTVASLFALRHLGVRQLALPAALLFTFVHYHQSRALGGHIPLGIGVFAIPLAVMLACKLCEPSFGAVWSRGFVVRNLLIVGLVAATGTIYYGLFAAYLFALAGAVRATRVRSWRGLLVPGAFVVAALGWAAATQVPAALTAYLHGYPVGVERGPSDSETFGLKLIELVFPAYGHRWDFLDIAARRYRRLAPLVNENVIAYVGVFAVAGIVAMSVGLVRQLGAGSRGAPSASVTRRRASTLRLFVLALFVLGTIGGLSSLIAFIGFPQIRSYNRVSIFIAFCALTYLAMILEPHVVRLRGGGKRALVVAVGALLTLFGLWEETLGWGADRQVAIAHYDRVGAFVQRIEALVPKATRVFQIPFVPSPDEPAVHDLPSYALMLPYLHSHQLAWSDGAFEGTPEATWSRETSVLPAAAMIDRLVAGDFGGLWVGRKGYADGGAALEADLTALLGEPLRDTDESLFYSLAAVRAAHPIAPGADGLARRQAAGLVVPSYRRGFYGAAGGLAFSRRRGTIGLTNLFAAAQQVAVDLDLTRPGNGATVTLQTPAGDETVEIPANDRAHVRRVVTLPPGDTIWTLTCSGSRAPVSPLEERDIWFGVGNLTLTLL